MGKHWRGTDRMSLLEMSEMRDLRVRRQRPELQPNLPGCDSPDELGHGCVRWVSKRVSKEVKLNGKGKGGKKVEKVVKS